MRAPWGVWGLLIGVMVLATGASGGVPPLAGSEGVGQARDWQHAGDVALSGRQLEVAYVFYKKVAETFPDTAHGRYAAKRARMLETRMLKPARSSDSEGPGNWIEEIFDFLFWP